MSDYHPDHAGRSRKSSKKTEPIMQMKARWWHRYRRVISIPLFCGPFILLAALLLYIFATQRPGPSNTHGIRYRAMALTYIMVSGSLWALARKFDAAYADEVMHKDKRPPIIYLRSFTVGPRVRWLSSSWLGGFQVSVTCLDHSEIKVQFIR
jgi:hypothetical protein